MLDKQQGLSAEEFGVEQERQEELHRFDPSQGNVAFCSAYDCWAFNLPGFIPNVAKKLGMRPKALCKLMWGQYYYNAGTKQVSKIPPSSSSVEMFVAFIMDPLVEKYRKFFSEEKSKNTALLREQHAKIKAKLSKLMPVDEGIFKMVIDHLPSPDQAQKLRYQQFCPILANPNISAPMKVLRDDIVNCNHKGAVTVFVTKMQAFSSRLYDITTRSQEKSTEKLRFVAISRVFSGVLKVGQKVLVMGARH